jgi:uncharacterized protein YbaP (TraB family)
MSPARGRETTASVPALKVTSRAGATSILIGSVHVGLPGLRQPTPALFSDMKLLVVEQVANEGPQAPKRKLTPGAQEVALKSGGFWPRAPWAVELTDAQVKTIAERVRCTPGWPVDQSSAPATQVILAMESAVTAQEIAIRPCSLPGLESRDAIIERAARAQGIKVVGLESQADVEKHRLDVPNWVYVQHIVAATSIQSTQALDKTVEGLNVGDYALVAQAVSGLTSDVKAKEIYYQAMVVERNKEWLPHLAGYLDQGSAVIVVGALHLPGQFGLLKLLKDSGYAVEPYSVPAIK